MVRSVKGGEEGEGGSKADWVWHKLLHLPRYQLKDFPGMDQGRVGHGSPVGEAHRLVLLQPTRQQGILGDPS